MYVKKEEGIGERKERVEVLICYSSKVVIFTNQAGIGSKGLDISKKNAITGKIEDLSAEVCGLLSPPSLYFFVNFLTHPPCS